MALALLSTAAWAAVGVSIPVIVYSDGDSEVEMRGELRRPRRLELHLCAAFRANGYTRNGGDLRQEDFLLSFFVLFILCFGSLAFYFARAPAREQL